MGLFLFPIPFVELTFLRTIAYFDKINQLEQIMEDKIKIPKKIETFLLKNEVKHELLKHKTVYTAFDKAATLKVKPGAIAKVLTVKMDGELAMAIVGGDRNLDMDKLLKLAKAKKINFAKEKIISETFKGIDPGAISPFAGLWQIKVYCDKKILESPKIILSAGSYEASIKMAPGAFKKSSSEMIIGNFSAPRQSQAKSGKAIKKKPKKKPVKPALNKRKK
jgi:prolyl-tRNA editing enzyme YbaK/EbsC (Cys-tRNA(Pro) deacylase)